MLRSRLLRFTLHRLGLSVLQLAGLVLVVFFVMRLLPADPVARVIGGNATPDMYRSTQHALGLDQPLWRQFASYLGVLPGSAGLLEGDLGRSWVTGAPVAQDIAHTLPITLELITLSFVLAFLVSVPLGTLCALRPGGIADRFAFGYSLFAGSQPEFWWGLLFIYFFFATMGWAPAPLGRLDPMMRPPPFVTGFITVDSILAGNMAALRGGLAHLALPVATKVFVLSGPIVKMVRQNMVRALSSEYILYARAAGVSPGQIAGVALKNALAPALTLLGVLYGYILGGAVLIETVFSLGGIGQYSVHAVLAFDYPAIEGVLLVIAAISLFVYLALDVVHALLDPRLAA